MQNLTLSEIIGRCLSEAAGLTYAHLPYGLQESFAEEIVSSANLRVSVQEDGGQFAFLVNGGPTIRKTDLCQNLSERESLRYRQCNHLIVLSHRQPDLASFNNVFRQTMSAGYPLDTSEELSFLRIATTYVRSLFDLYGWSDPVLEADVATRIVYCLETASNIFQSEQSRSIPWNTTWFRHVSTAFTALQRQLERLIESSPGSISRRNFFAQYTCPSFGLPRSSDKSKLSAALFRKAWDTYWFDEAEINSSIRKLAHHPEVISSGMPHPLQHVSFDNFTQRTAALDSGFHAFSSIISDRDGGVEALSHLTVSQFLNPEGPGEDAFLKLYSSDGAILHLPDARSAEPFFVELRHQGMEAISESMRIEIPALRGPSTAEVEASRADIQISGRTYSWVGKLALDEQGRLFAEGFFRRKINASRPSISFSNVGVYVDIPKGDSLSGYIGHPTSRVCFYPTGSEFTVYSALASRVTKYKYVGPSNMFEGTFFGGERDEFIRDLQESAEPRKYRVAVINGAGSDNLVSLNGTPVLPSDSDGRFTILELNASGWDVVQGRRAAYIFQKAGAKGQQSPLHAAISKESISTDPPAASDISSFRGLVEQYYADNVDSTKLSDCLGHIFLAAEVETGLKQLTSLDDNVGLIPEAAKTVWERNILFDVPADFIRGSAAVRFREAFAALKMRDMVSRTDKDESPYNELISKLSYATIPIRAVNEYVEAYANLVEAAVATGNPSAVYWAAYPMSVSIWGTQTDYGIQATFLSPWHPLRLSWLAGAESTLREARQAERLAGLVEGWNFPYVGPRETSNSRSVAVPMDSAQDQLFLGWSLMVPVAVDRYEPLRVPERAAGMDLPGTATSGLNGQAATAALASYKSMRPHLSTLTIDLAAQQNTPRLREIDSAVLNLARNWSRESRKATGQLIGGLRVLDSLKRVGDVPTDDVRNLVRSDPDLLITWSRYSPDPVESKTSNIRLLQDAGVRQYISKGTRKEGAAGPIPLRRFGGPVGSTNGPRTGTYFAPSIKNARTTFLRAVDIVESVYGVSEISSMIFNTPLGDGKADWTVSGESMLGPAALASLLGRAKSRGDSAHMLWEWRPPMFEPVGTTTAELERRPYVSVAKVPPAFEAKIIRALKGTSPVEPENAARDLITTLGTRGVGLSRLLSRGGTHVSGAVGFYAAFKALQLLHPMGEADQFVIPLDAADSFLKAMIGNASHRTERADLLLIRLKDESLILSPVEIKCYGLSTSHPPTRLPTTSAAVFRKANDQLEATKKLLEALVAEYDDSRLRSDADLLLWANALTALIEVGARLQPISEGESDNERLAERMSSCAAGEINIEVGRPLVLYFQDTQGLNSDHYVSYLNMSDRGAEIGLMVTDLSHALSAAAQEEPQFASDLKDLIDWSMQQVDHFSSAPVQNPVQSQGALIDEMTIENRDSGEQEKMHEDSQVSHASSNRDLRMGQDSPASEVLVRGDGVHFDVGYTLDTVGKGIVDHWPSNTEMTQMNLGVVGDLGTGKTEFLKAYISRMRSVSRRVQTRPISFLIFDYKGDFQDPSFLADVDGRSLVPRHMPINIFSKVTDEHNKQPYQQAAAFVDILRKIYSGVGIVQSETLNTVVRQLFSEKYGEPPTLAEVRDAYSSLVGKPDSVLSILNGFVYGNIFSDDKSELKAFAELLDGGVLVVALDKLGTDENMKNALVAMFLNLYYDYMITSEKLPFTGSDPQLRHLNSFLVVDEAVNIMKYEFPALMNLMLQGRQFGMGVVLASQYLSHFREAGTNYGQPLNSWVIHKVPSVTPKELEQLGFANVPQTVTSRIPFLGRHEVLYKSLGNVDGTFVRMTPYYEL